MHKILVLTSMTGGGHHAVAEALKAEFTIQFGERFQVDIVDLLADYLPWPLNQVTRSYHFLANDAPWLLKILWRVYEQPPFSNLYTRWAEKWVEEAFEKYLPDLIISVHPLTQHMSIRALRHLEHRVPFVTVVTDLFDAHSPWFHPDVEFCYVASEAAYNLGLKAGLRPAQMRKYGLPTRQSFLDKPPAKEQIRHSLGMHPHLPAVLLLGGGTGIGPIVRIAHSVASSLGSNGLQVGQLAVICGRNQKIVEKLESFTWPVPTNINGYINNMSEWMAACDCIITKAGSVTITEAFLMGKPLLISNYLPGQEDGNVAHVVTNSAGSYNKDPIEIALVIKRWFTQERSILDEMSRRGRQLARPQATAKTVREIADILVPGLK